MVEILLAVAAAQSEYKARQKGQVMPAFDRADRIRFGAGLVVLVVLFAAISLHGALHRPMPEPVRAWSGTPSTGNDPHARTNRTLRYGLALTETPLSRDDACNSEVC
jgi:hypothetical protein